MAGAASPERSVQLKVRVCVRADKVCEYEKSATDRVTIEYSRQSYKPIDSRALE